MTGKSVNEEAAAKMAASLNENINMVDGRLEKVRKTAEDLSLLVSTSYKNTDMATYKDVFSQIINADPLVLGSGIWFEPEVYTGDEKYAGQKYVGPYWYKDGTEIVEDWEYSNAEYDYFVQEYYVNAKAITSLDATMTDPYYDPSSGIV